MHGQTHAAYQMLVSAYQCVLRRMHSRNVRALAGTALILGAGGALAPKARAATYTWNNGAANGLWEDAGNWGPGGSNWSIANADVAVFGATPGVVTATVPVFAGSTLVGTAGGVGGDGVAALVTPVAGTPGTAGVAGNLTISNGILTITNILGGVGGGGGNAGVGAALAGPGGAGGDAGGGVIEISGGDVTVSSNILLGGNGGKGGNAGLGTVAGASGGAGGIGGTDTMLISGGNVITNTLVLGGNGGNGGNGASIIGLAAAGASGGAGGNGVLTLSSGSLQVLNDVQLGGGVGTPGAPGLINIVGANGGTGGAAGTGTLNLGGTGALNIGGNLALGSGSTLNIGTTDLSPNTTAGTLAIAGAITNNGAINFNQTDTFTLANDISGAGTLTQSGVGTTTLSGASLGFTGPTTVSDGTLLLTGSLGSNIGVGNGATLGGSGLTTGSITLNAGSTLIGGASGSSVRGASVVAPGGAGSVTVVGTDGTNSVGTHTLGIIRYNTGSGPASNVFDVSNYRTAGANDVALGGGINEMQLVYETKDLVWDPAAGTWDNHTTADWQGSEQFYQGDFVTFDDTGAGAGGARDVTLDQTVTPGRVTFNNNTDTYTLQGAGAIAGTTTLTKNGDGTTFLANNNTYTGGTSLNGGVLVLASAEAVAGGSAGSIGGTGSDIELNGGVIGLGAGNASFTRDLGPIGSAGEDTINFAGSGGFAAYGADASVNIGGAGATLAWGSTLNFLGDGDTLILGSSTADKTVDFQNALDLGTAQRTVQVDHDGVDSVDAILSGGLTGTTGGLNKTGEGTLALTGASSYTGDTHVADGELIIGNDVTGATLATGTGHVDAPATLTVGGGTAASSLTSSGLFTNAGTFNIGDGAGAAGTAVANITGGLANAGTVTVKSDGTLALTSDVTGAGTITTDAGGLLTLANGADIANDITNAGTTTVKDGISAITGTIANTGTVNVGDTIDGPGTATLNLAADITGVGGTVTVNSDGVLNLSNDADISSALANDGTTTVVDGTSILSGAVTNNAGKNFNIGDGVGPAGSAAANITGGLDNAGTVTVNSDGTLALTSDVSGAGTLATAAGGLLTLSNGADIANALTNAGTTTLQDGTSNFTGAFINTGTFNIGDAPGGVGTDLPGSAVANVTGAWANDGTVNVRADGQLTGGDLTNNGMLNVDGTITANVTVTGTGTIGGAGGTTTGSLALDSGATLIGAAGSGAGNPAAGLTASGPITLAPGVIVLGAFNGSGVMDVLGTGTDNTLDLTAFDTSAFRGGDASGAGLTFDDLGGGNYKIMLTAGQETGTWAAAGPTGTWDNTHGAGTWTNGTDNAYYSGDDVVFNDVAGQPAVTVTLGDTVTPSSMTFGNTSGNPGTSTAYVFDGPGHIAGSTGLTMNDSGTVTMNTDNTYTGDTVVNAGTLLVNGNTNNGAGNYTVGDGVGGPTATLGGSGTITLAGDGVSTGVFTANNNGQLTGGNLAATGSGNFGNGPGTNDPAAGDIGHLTINAAQTNLNGTYVFDVDYGDLGGGDETGDLLSFTGDVDLTGAVFQIGEEFGHTVAGEHYYIKIFESANTPTGGPPVFQLSAAALARGESVVTWDGGKTYYLVPEPASFALLALGSLLLLRRPSRRRGRKSPAAA